jgi:hypothetical protein
MAPALTHVETTIVPGQRLGLRPRDPAREVLKLGDYLTGIVPVHPPAVDYLARITSQPAGQGWILGGNNKFSTCGPTSLANYRLLVSTWLGSTPVRPTDEQVFDLYRRSGNPRFDPTTGADDNGVDMTVMLSAAIQGGLGGSAPLAFAEVDTTNTDEVWAAGALFGGTLWAADLSEAQQTQTPTGLWDYSAGSPDWGGHAIMAASRYQDLPGTVNDRTGLITWAQPLDVTDVFISRQVMSRYVVIWPEHLGSKAFLQGVNLSALAADYQALTGHPFPTPQPTPGVVTAWDQALADGIRDWAHSSRVDAAVHVKHAQQLVLSWLTASGL